MKMKQMKMFVWTIRIIITGKSGKKCGFVSPFGASATSDYAYADWASFVAWILTEEKAERDADMKKWSRLQEKYDLVIQYYRQYYQLDLEQLAEQCQKLTVK